MTRSPSVFLITWLSLVSVAAFSVGVLAWLSRDSARVALQEGLRDHVTAQAGLVAASVADVPVEALATLGGARSLSRVDERLTLLREGGGLSDIALCGPDGTILGSDGDWLPGRAEQDLVAEARAGRSATGPLYTAVDGLPYMTAYRPLPGHAGWVVAVEGSAATLGAADALFRTQVLAGLLVVLAVGAAAALAATLSSRPLVRLDRELRQVGPGDPPERVTVRGPREVRRVAATVAALLEEIRRRDGLIESAHEAQLRELTRLAAGVAHEVRNPLNAMALTVQRLARSSDDRAAARLLGQVRDLEVIVGRLLDLTAPVEPQLERVDAFVVLREVARDVGVDVHPSGAAWVSADRGLLAQVFRNVLLNAAQAGAQRVDVSAAPEEGGVALRLIDDGPGVSPDDEPRLFDWFHTGRAQGSGLGLPQSRRLVRAMGGTLTLGRPRPATFRLWLGAS
ncbi:MAG: hypothetical protein KTR31_31340 [Myxococcales bacterium]|nr:hypothetical protein [Myxococcales bacterium]